MRPLRRTFDRGLELPSVYRALQGPFAEAKLRPFLRRVDPGRLGSVLDVGCGPGTNASTFDGTDYLGIDINPDYIDAARKRASGRFVVGDVADPTVLPEREFECVFANSLLHHLPDDVVDSLVARMAGLAAPGGAVHILDLVLPERPSLALILARLDRGRYPRHLRHWRTLLGRHLAERHMETYSVGLPGLPMWEMLYFEGVAR